MVVEPVVVVKVEPEAETTAVRAEVVIGVPLSLPLPFIPPAPPMPPALEEPIIPLLVAPALAPEPVAVMDMEPEPAPPAPARGTVAEPAIEEPLAEARATMAQVRLKFSRVISRVNAYSGSSLRRMRWPAGQPERRQRKPGSRNRGHRSRSRSCCRGRKRRCQSIRAPCPWQPCG